MKTYNCYAFIRRKAVVFLCLVSLPALAMTSAENLQEKLNTIKTMQASFVQEIRAKNTDTNKSNGKMALSKPSRFRWQTQKPMPQLFIADGSQLWIYDEELEQVSVRKQNKNLSGAAAIFLSDENNNVGQDFTVKMKHIGSSQYFDLRAKSSQATFARVGLVFKGEIIKQIDLYDELGQHTQVSFSNVKLNPKLSPTLFKFVVPAGTDVVRQ